MRPGTLSQALPVAEALIERFEGFRSQPYLCPAGYPTIGFGTVYYADGKRVTLADAPVTREQARVLLRSTLRTTYIPAVIKLCPGADTPGRVAALIDFAYNLGAGNLKASTLRRRVNQGDWEAAVVELNKWVRGGGKVLRGLVLRRQAEAALI